MEWIGYILAIVVGITIGLMGSGGSILTLPILVYILHIEASLATSYSLFMVGAATMVGTISQTFKKNIDFKTAFFFATPSLITAYFTRTVLLHLIPNEIFLETGLPIKKSFLLMVVFGIVMTVVALSMILSKKTNSPAEITAKNKNRFTLFFIGLAVGLLTGLIGVGGGFLIVPALVLLNGMPIKKAMGTSMLIIALNSAIGFIGDIHANVVFDWRFLLVYTLLILIGLFMGIALSQKISGEKLKKGFGWFVLTMGFLVLFLEMTKLRKKIQHQNGNETNVTVYKK